MAKKKLGEKENMEKPPKRFKFYLGSKEKYITIRSDFDSGNIDVVRQISEFHVHYFIYVSIGSQVFMMVLLLTIVSIQRAGFTFQFLVFHAIQKASSLSQKFRLCNPYIMYNFSNFSQNIIKHIVLYFE